VVHHLVVDPELARAGVVHRPVESDHVVFRDRLGLGISIGVATVDATLLQESSCGSEPCLLREDHEGGALGHVTRERWREFHDPVARRPAGGKTGGLELGLGGGDDVVGSTHGSDGREGEEEREASHRGTLEDDWKVRA
jgi:hypothetical protein